MATTFIEPGGDADFGTGLWSSIVSSPTIVTDFVHGSHLKSIKYRPNAASDVVVKSAILADAGGRLSIYFYFVAFPASTSSICNLYQSGAVTVVIRMRITSGGIITLYDANSQLGSNGATLSTGKWYRLSLAWKITSSSVNELRLFVDGVLSISVTNGTIANTSMADVGVGNNGGETTLDFRTSDHYFDNSNTLTDPGNIWVTAKRPNANGTTNGFTTQIGSGGSGYGTGHSPQVNERPNSDTNGWSITTVASAITEEYNIESVSQGDINITGSIIVDYMGWLRSKALASETAQIIINNVSSNISLTSTITFFTKIAGSTTYPAGTGTDIGEISAAVATTISLYECGIVVAYIPASSNATFKTLLGVGNI